MLLQLRSMQGVSKELGDEHLWMEESRELVGKFKLVVTDWLCAKIIPKRKSSQDLKKLPSCILKN